MNVAKARSDKEIDQTHNTDIEDGSKLTNWGESSEVRGLKSLEIKQKELPQKPSVEQLLSKLQELSSTNTNTNAGSSEHDIPSGYMIPMLQSKD